MKSRLQTKRTWMLFCASVATASLISCGSSPEDATVPQTEPEPEPDAPLAVQSSQTALVDAVTGAALQATTTGEMVHAWLSVDKATNATEKAMAVQETTTAALVDVHTDVGSTVEALGELQGTMIDAILPVAGAAATQMLSLNPSDPNGPIAGTFGGCGRITGVFAQEDIDELNPPFLRIEVDYDPASAPSCQAEGTIWFDLRLEATATVLVVQFPEGLTFPYPGGLRKIAANSIISFGLRFDVFPFYNGIELAADYCASDVDGGQEVCLRNLTMDVQAGLSFSEDNPFQVTDATLSFMAIGTVSAFGNTVSWGAGDVPLSVELSADQDLLLLSLNGQATSDQDGVIRQIAFEGPEGDVESGLRVELRPGVATLDISGCFASTLDGSTRKTCAQALAFAAEPIENRGLRFAANGTIVRTEDARVTTTVADNVRLEVDRAGARLDGHIVESSEESQVELRFVGLMITPTGIDGSFGLYKDGERLYGIDICPGTGLSVDTPHTWRLSGCLVIENPEQTVSLGALDDPAVLTINTSSIALDGTWSIAAADGTPNLVLDVDNLRAELLTSDGLQFRLAGAGSITHHAQSGRIAIVDALTVQVAAEDQNASVTVDGDIGVELDSTDATVAGQVRFTEAQITARNDGFDIVGTVGLAFDPEASGLPSDDISVQLGEAGTPFRTTSKPGDTRLDGRAMIGLACDSPTGCASTVEARLNGVTFANQLCGRPAPNGGSASLSGLSLALAVPFPALRVTCECNGRDGDELLVAESLTMVFDANTPTDGMIDVPEATGACLAVVNPGTECNSPGTAQLWVSDIGSPTDIVRSVFPACQ